MTLGKAMSVGPSLWSRWKYHCLMDCHDILYRHSWFPEDVSYGLSWSPGFSSSATVWLTFLGWYIYKYRTDCHEIWYTYVDGFDLPPPEGHNCHLTCEISQDLQGILVQNCTQTIMVPMSTDLSQWLWWSSNFSSGTTRSLTFVLWLKCLGKYWMNCQIEIWFICSWLPQGEL